jgi:Ribose/xylose/arabinose/galactoside ABC-type transport systems, permease components
MLLALLIILWIVFESKDNAKDAALIALGRKPKNVFNIKNMLGGMGVYMLYSFMALGMALILGMGDIDISVGASATFSASVMGVLYRTLVNGGMANGTAFTLAIIACLLTGALCGLLNGVLITKFRELFPMIVTLGTMLFYRGFCYLFLGGDTLKFEGDETWVKLKTLYNGSVTIGKISVPAIIFWFLGMALIFYIFLHKTTGGRKLFAIGENRTAALYSGIRVDRFEMMMFVICGLMAAVSSLFYVGCASATVRADAMQGYEMYAIAVAVLGGFSTDGGKGNIIGVVLSVVIFGVMKKGLGTLFGFSDSTVNLAVGIVLILASLLPNIIEDISNKRRIRKQHVDIPA